MRPVVLLDCSFMQSIRPHRKSLVASFRPSLVVDNVVSDSSVLLDFGNFCGIRFATENADAFFTDSELGHCLRISGKNKLEKFELWKRKNGKK